MKRHEAIRLKKAILDLNPRRKMLPLILIYKCVQGGRFRLRSQYHAYEAINPDYVLEEHK